MNQQRHWHIINSLVCWLLFALLGVGIVGAVLAVNIETLGPRGILIFCVFAGPLAAIESRSSWWLEAGLVFAYIAATLYSLGRFGRTDSQFTMIGLTLAAAWLLCGFFSVAVLG